MSREHLHRQAKVHGVSGNVVGDTDTQTLTNKTLVTPVMDHISAADGDLNVDSNLSVLGTVGAVGDIVSTTGKVKGIGVPPAGAILMYGASAAPTGWLLCDGSAVSRSTYATLFGVVGTTYGVGDGSTTFNLPNFGSKFPRGNTPGTGAGADTHTHTLSDAGQAQIAIQAGAPDLFERRVAAASYTANFQTTTTVGSTASTTTAAAGAALTGATDSASNVPAYTGVTFIIYAG